MIIQDTQIFTWAIKSLPFQIFVLTFDAFLHVCNGTLSKYDLKNHIISQKANLYVLLGNLTIWWNLHFDMEHVIPKTFQFGSFAWMHETGNDFFKKTQQIGLKIIWNYECEICQKQILFSSFHNRLLFVTIRKFQRESCVQTKTIFELSPRMPTNLYMSISVVFVSTLIKALFGCERASGVKRKIRIIF